MRLTADSHDLNVALSDIHIEGHASVVGIIQHETSKTSLYCYEGTLSGAKTGTVNLLYFRSGPSSYDTLYSISRFSTEPDVIYKGDGSSVGYRDSNRNFIIIKDSILLVFGPQETSSYIPKYKLSVRLSKDSSVTKSTWWDYNRPDTTGAVLLKRSY